MERSSTNDNVKIQSRTSSGEGWCEREGQSWTGRYGLVRSVKVWINTDTNEELEQIQTVVSNPECLQKSLSKINQEWKTSSTPLDRPEKIGRVRRGNGD